MQVSVVINTINRPDTLKKCLESLEKQSDKDFEVIIIDQSRDDDTEELVKSYYLKYVRSNVRNLSVSRNIGIDYSSGDIVAFIDDDACADIDWVKNIKLEMDGNQILVGKVIEARLGEEKKLQYQNGIVSEYGDVIDIRPADEVTYQKGYMGWYLRPMGANSIFTKESLESVNGFDQFYEYNHDETDVTIRIIKQGGKAKYVDSVIVDHYMQDSHNRKGKFHLNWYVQSKNNVYFGIKNSSDTLLIRVVRSLLKVTLKKTHYPRLLKFLIYRKISIFRFIQDLYKFNLGIVVGISAGVFGNRNLYRFSGKFTYLPFRRK